MTAQLYGPQLTVQYYPLIRYKIVDLDVKLTCHVKNQHEAYVTSTTPNNSNDGQMIQACEAHNFLFDYTLDQILISHIVLCENFHRTTQLALTFIFLPSLLSRPHRSNCNL